MGGIRWNVSAGAILVFALLYFFDDAGLFAALAPAVMVHELGHVAALRSFRARLRRVSVGVFGIEMDYGGILGNAQTALSVAAGPAAGALYALIACSIGGEFWRLSGAVSFCLTVFNLLPVLPLDGGRLVAVLAGRERAERLSRIMAPFLLLCGAALLTAFHAPALLAAGAWLCLFQFRD